MAQLKRGGGCISFCQNVAMVNKLEEGGKYTISTTVLYVWLYSYITKKKWNFNKTSAIRKCRFTRS